MQKNDYKIIVYKVRFYSFFKQFLHAAVSASCSINDAKSAWIYRDIVNELVIPDHKIAFRILVKYHL